METEKTTQEWLEKFQALAAEKELELARLRAENEALRREIVQLDQLVDHCHETRDALRHRAEAAEQERDNYKAEVENKPKTHGWIPELLIDHDRPVCEICHGFIEEHEGEALITEAYHALRDENERLLAFKALADDEWAGSEEDFISVETWGEMQRKRETCYGCNGHQDFSDVGHRPFPHSQNCRKARYDALTAEQPEAQELVPDDWQETPPCAKCGFGGVAVACVWAGDEGCQLPKPEAE